MGRHAARQRTGSAGRRTGSALALCCTALAAGAGGVVLHALPESSLAGSQPAVVADQPLAPLAPATATGTTSAPQPARHQPERAGGSAVAADRDESRTPLPTAPRTAAATAAPSATATATASPSNSPVTAAVGAHAAKPVATVLSLVNQERAKAGCAPLTADARLDALATAFSDDMAARGFFSHTDPDGHTPWDRARAASIGYLGGENIARGQRTPEDVMAAWMSSPGHRANILNCHYTKLGVGMHHGPDGPWWTQDFGF